MFQALDLPPNILRKREVIRLDIANDCSLQKADRQKFTADKHPTKYKSELTGRGPLEKGWELRVAPVMCCYKLVICYFKWIGLQGMVERKIQDMSNRFLKTFNRELWCLIDKWYPLNMKQIREMEEETKQLLEKQKNQVST